MYTRSLYIVHTRLSYVCAYMLGFSPLYSVRTNPLHTVSFRIGSCQAPVVLFSDSTRYIEIEVLAIHPEIEGRRQAPIIDRDSTLFLLL